MRFHAQPEGEHLPPELWQQAPNWQTALERCKHFQPSVIYVQKGDLVHKNGMPMLVTKYNITWGQK